MNNTDWNNTSESFAVINDFSRDVVLQYIRQRLIEIKSKTLLDYGAGDGDFVVLCADLPITIITAYDPAPNMVTLARKACSAFSQIKVVQSTSRLSHAFYDVVVLNAVWMCLPTYESCTSLLDDIHKLLTPNGRLIASVTHPCFRTSRFSTTVTNFDNRNYLNNGINFEVQLHDGLHGISIVDTHWNISAMSKQLKQSRFYIDEITEFPDKLSNDDKPEGSPWMVIEAVKRL